MTALKNAPTPEPDLSNPISDIVKTIEGLVTDIGKVPASVAKDIKVVIAGIADLIEHLLSKDVVYFVGQFTEQVATAMNTLLRHPEAVKTVLSTVEQAFTNVTEGKAAIERVEAMATRCDAASMGLAERLDLKDTSLVASSRHNARLKAERDALMQEALILPGMASAYGLDAHLADFAEDLATRTGLTGDGLEDELALVQMTRRRVIAAETGVSVAGSVSAGGDVAAYLGIGGSISIGLSKYLANVDARLHRYETLLKKAATAA